MMLERATSADVPAVVALMNVAFRGPVAGWNTEAAYIDGQRTSLALLTEEIAAKPDAALLLWRADSRLVGSV